MLNRYGITYEEYDPALNTFTPSYMEFQGPDVLHVVNQLLDFYRNLDARVAVIESCIKLNY